MKRLFFLLLLPVAFSLTSFTIPSSKNSAVIAENEGVFDLNFSHYNECTGEMMDVTGTLSWSIHAVFNNNRVTWNRREVIVVHAIGQTTGAVYSVRDATHFNEHGTYGFMPYTLNVQRNWKMIGPGKLQNYMLRGRYKVTVTATGEVTAEHGGFDIECRG
jgi:hypothetical protein